MGKGKKRMSYDNMRVGKRYTVINHGETHSFEVTAAVGKNDFMVKDLGTLERYPFSDLVRYGLGDDFELYEI